MGFQYEFAALFKFVFQIGSIAFPNGTVPANNCYTELCAGFGADFDMHIAPVMGVISSGNPEDLKGPAFMVDADLSFIVHLIGGAIGWTVPDCIFRSEFSSAFTADGAPAGIGMGGGIGFYQCGSVE